MRVFILSGHSMFIQGVERLLRRDTQLDIVGCTDVNNAVEYIKALQPDVIIVDSNHPAYDLASELMRILRQGSAIKIIGLSLQDNTICIYRGEKRVVKEVADLVEAIEQS